MNYSFMKAGQGHPSAPDASSQTDDQVDHLVRQLMSASLALVTRGGKAAATYAAHAHRSSVHEKDVIMAMQFQSKVFLDHVTDDEVADAREAVDDAIDAESDDSSGIESSDDDTLKDDTSHPWTASTCECEVCTGMNDAHATWDEWHPEDEVLVYLKRTTTKFMNRKQ